MGFTHAFYVAPVFDKKAFAKVSKDFRKMVSQLSQLGVELGDGCGVNTPITSPTKIEFNGLGKGGCEPFSLVLKFDAVRAMRHPSSDGKYARFCKTEYQPYDLAVTVCLVIAKHYLKDDISVYSDGDITHWQKAMQLCQDSLGYGKKFALDIDE